MSDGVVVSRTRELVEVGNWMMKHLCFHHFFKGLDGNPTTEEMENFRHYTMSYSKKM